MTQQAEASISIRATAAVVANRFIQATGLHMIDTDVATVEFPIGVSQAAAAIGDMITTSISGVVEIEAGEAIAAGEIVFSGASGVAMVTTLTPAQGYGVAITSAADGELVEVLLTNVTAIVTA